ncbi:MAG: type III polyketide synthase [Planctomycetota bacterium]|nr:type III polyketide synthase [Planctomycetota bacterium]MDA1139585.1 type III polyketide synthase [Planctomycetota bacterium]
MTERPKTFDHSTTNLLSVGTALPPHKLSQEQAATFMMNTLAASPSGEKRDRAMSLVERVFPGSGIENRYTVIPDYLESDPSRFEFYPPNWELEPFPTTAARMSVFEEWSVKLAEEAANTALMKAGLSPEDVTHLIICTCTGFFAPGPDILLQQRLGLRPSVNRLLLGFMGCYAGLSGVRAADDIVRGNPDAVVLQVAVELCSLHFQKRPEPDFMFAHCLFGDGCGAAVFAGEGASHSPLARLVQTHSFVTGNSLDQMSWRIGDTGFEMRLSPQVPKTLAREVGHFMEHLLKGYVSPDEVGTWAIHPGGRKILEELQRVFEWNDEQLEPSFGVLRDYSNMSSATIFFVLDECLKRGWDAPIAALGFGPGLTIEGFLLQPVNKKRAQWVTAPARSATIVSGSVVHHSPLTTGR